MGSADELISRINRIIERMEDKGETVRNVKCKSEDIKQILDICQKYKSKIDNAYVRQIPSKPQYIEIALDMHPMMFEMEA